MGDPYEILGVTPGAGEGAVRERYLELVRAFPPIRLRKSSRPFTPPTAHCVIRSSVLKGRFSVSTVPTTRSSGSWLTCATG